MPLYLLSRADPNVLLEMSVETPMGGAAYNDQAGNPRAAPGASTCSAATEVGSCYIPATKYIGYFNPLQCYTYSGRPVQPEQRHRPTTPAAAQWNGNFLNWATMTAIDMFTFTMTGGNRIVDTTAATVIKRARKTDNAAGSRRRSSDAATTLRRTPSRRTDATIYIYNTAFGFQVGTTFAKATGTPDLGHFQRSVSATRRSARPPPAARDATASRTARPPTTSLKA